MSDVRIFADKAYGPNTKVFIGDHEVQGVVRVEIDDVAPGGFINCRITLSPKAITILPLSEMPKQE